MNESIYARPAPPRIRVRPALATVALHALLIYVMTVNWSSAERTVTVKPVPKVINARLVDISEFQPKPVEKPKAKPQARKPAPKKAQPRRSKPVQKARPKTTAPSKPKPEPAAAPKPEPKPEPKPDPRLSNEELQSMAANDILRAMEQEDAVAAALTAEQMTASYAALIQQTVMSYWSRPPSARNGMEALLSIQLIPNGDVVSVTVMRSSGSAAFDRSAMNAVEKAASFPELQQLPRNEFEKTFRRFSLLFRPEDLRY